jgi:putative peptidoglycan lipid II flippase
MSLARNFATVGVATLSSRILGFIRDMLMAAALGTGPVADAFFVAFRIPNLFRRLFAEGAFNSAFVPMFARRLEGDGQNTALLFARQAMSGLLFVLLILTLIVEIAMPVVMLVLAPGFSDDPEKFDLAVLLTRICFPYLVFVSMLALISGALNGLSRFAVAAFAPTLLNVILIGVLMLILNQDQAGMEWAGIALSVGVLFGGIAQVAMVWIALRRAGLMLTPVRPIWNADMKRLVELGIPGVLAGGITQINIMVGTMIATLQDGAVSYLYYADRLYQLPLGVVGIAIGVVLLPELARQLKAGHEKTALSIQNRSLEFAMVLTLPAAVALAVLADPIIRVLFERGAFTALATEQTAHALVLFALGLPSFVLIKVFQPGFFAREDTKTPMKIAGLGAVLNIVASFALFLPFGHVGIAAATSFSGWVQAGLLFYLLNKSNHFTLEAKLLRRTGLQLLSAIIMGCIVFGLAHALENNLQSSSPLLLQITSLGVLVLTGVSVFFGLAHMTGGMDLRTLKTYLTKRSDPVVEES